LRIGRYRGARRTLRRVAADEEGEDVMAKYITLYQFTDQGIKNYEGTVQRSKDATAAVEKMGGKLLSINWTIGPYDLVSISQFPDDETATAFNLKLAAAGNVRTTTMRAFDSDEMTRIIGKTK
jgi:uncharacterized protein with GYD domain